MLELQEFGTTITIKRFQDMKIDCHDSQTRTSRKILENVEVVNNPPNSPHNPNEPDSPFFFQKTENVKYQALTTGVHEFATVVKRLRKHESIIFATDDAMIKVLHNLPMKKRKINDYIPREQFADPELNAKKVSFFHLPPGRDCTGIIQPGKLLRSPYPPTTEPGYDIFYLDIYYETSVGKISPVNRTQLKEFNAIEDPINFAQCIGFNF